MAKGDKSNFVVPEMRSIRNIHLIGIAGSGMCGIAEVLFNLGYLVSGSDLSQGSVTDRLKMLGITTFSKHDPSNIGNADVIVCSSAIDQENPELREAIRRRVPVIPRAEMLSELMRMKFR